LRDNLKAMIKFFVPRIVQVKNNENNNPRKATEQDDLVEKAISWWKNDEYTKVQKFKNLRWLGLTFFRIPYYETVKGIYFKPAIDLVKIVKKMQKDKIIPSLDKNSKIFESGCNVGRNLYYLQKAFNCEVVGIDISQQAIDIAKNKIWKNREKYEFHIGNVLTTDFFDQFTDNYFDLVFTRWHLIHIPLSAEKKKYVESLKRISKILVLLEPVRQNCNEVELYQDGRYTLSWDDWVSEYNLKEYKSNLLTKRKDNTKAFYFLS